MIDGSVLQSAQRCFEKKSRVVVKMVVNPKSQTAISLTRKQSYNAVRSAAREPWQSEILEEFRREGFNPPGPISTFV